jgi:hypothetical protein
MAGYLTKRMLGAVGLAGVLALGISATASASTVTGTATLTAGTLAYTPPTTIAFASTITGIDHAATTTQAFVVNDNTGSGAGWNITVTSTQFTTGGGTPNLLSTVGTTDTGAVGACTVSVTCTLGNNAAITYPVTVPAGTTAPTAIKIQTAALNSGLAGQTWTHTMSLDVPAVALAGAYTSTWTYSLVTGP